MSNKASKANRWYYRLGNSECNDFLWSGTITSTSKVDEAEVRRAICKRERLNRLPANTVVVSEKRMHGAKRAIATARSAMGGTTTRTKPVALKPKTFAEVGDAPITPADVAALLKKFGLT